MPRTPISFTFGNSGVLSIRPEWQFTTTTARDNYFTANPTDLATIKNSSTAGVFFYIKVGSQFQYNDPVSNNWIVDDKVIMGPEGSSGMSIKSVRFKEETSDKLVYEIVMEDDSIIGTIDIPKDPSSTVDLEAFTKLFGDQTKALHGRLRFDPNVGHWYFEQRQGDGSYITKLEVGGSITIDVIRFIKGAKPTVPAGEIGLYLREITLPDNSKTIRPEIVLETGKEFGFVVNDQTQDIIVYRKNDGTLGSVPKTSDLEAVEVIAKNAVNKISTNSLGNIELKDDNDKVVGIIPIGDLNDEDVQDIVGAMLVNGTHQNVTVSYDDVNGVINLTASTTAQPTTPDSLTTYVDAGYQGTTANGRITTPYKTLAAAINGISGSNKNVINVLSGGSISNVSLSKVVYIFAPQTTISGNVVALYTSGITNIVCYNFTGSINNNSLVNIIELSKLVKKESDGSIKATDFIINDETKLSKAMMKKVNNIVGLDHEYIKYQDKVTWEASTQEFPPKGNDNSDIKKGFLFVNSKEGIVNSISFFVDDVVIAKVDNPGNVSNNWIHLDGGEYVHSIMGYTGVIDEKRLKAMLLRIGVNTNHLEDFTEYYGFNEKATIGNDDPILSTLTKFDYANNPETTLEMSQDGTKARYAWIIFPDQVAQEITHIVQGHGLAANWIKTDISIGGEPFTAFRSPHKMWDTQVTFHTSRLKG